MPVIQPITSASSGSAYVPTSRVLTINGVAYDLTADRSWTVEVLDNLIATAPLSYDSGTNTISIPAATGSVDGYLLATDWLTFSSKQPAITLTTTGNNGAATLVGATLNIPEYTLAGLGGMANVFTTLGDLVYSNSAGAPVRRSGNITTTKMFLSQTGDGSVSAAPQWSAVTSTDTGSVPTSRTITINGTTQDLSADRTYSVGTVTSVAALTLGTTGTDISSSVANGTTTPVITLNIPTASAANRGALSSADWTTFNAKQPALSGTGFVKISGTTISYDNSTYYLASNPSNYITLTSLSAGTGITYNNTTGVITSTITQYTDALARAAISLTTTGSSGSSTYNSTTGVLNVPTYTAAGLGAVPTSRTITINDVVFDLTANREWSVGDFGTW
jgi:hypothetical protein